MRRRGAPEANDHLHAHPQHSLQAIGRLQCDRSLRSVKVNPGQVQGEVRGWSRLSKDLKGDLRRRTSPRLTDLLTGLFAGPRRLLRRPAGALAPVPRHPHFSAPDLQAISRIDDHARRSVPSPRFAVDRGRNRVEPPEVRRRFVVSTPMRIYPLTYPNAGPSRSRRAEVASPDALPPGAFRFPEVGIEPPHLRRIELQGKKRAEKLFGPLHGERPCGAVGVVVFQPRDRPLHHPAPLGRGEVLQREQRAEEHVSILPPDPRPPRARRTPTRPRTLMPTHSPPGRRKATRTEGAEASGRRARAT
ncbi:hypothetical protein M2436_004892 [Streptomyces sp. HB372]|nr:hypothetical protein [Streptomyces sp. HB372]